MKKTFAIAAVLILAMAGASVFLIQNHDKESDTVVVKDMLGDSVEVKKNPRVACVSRNSYDPLVSFGLRDYIDGTYETTLENKWVYEMEPTASKLFVYDYSESPETYIERGVDLVLAPEHHNNMASNLREHGIATIVLWPYGNPTYEPYLYFIADLAKQLWPDVEGVAEKADAWKKDLSDTLDLISSTIKEKGLTSKTLYYARGEKNRLLSYTDIGGSFVDFAFTTLGVNYLSSKYEYNKPSTEQLLADDPKVIVLGSYQQHALEKELRTNSIWENVTAVKNDEIYRIPIGFSPMEYTSAFAPVFLCDMANKLYPEVFHFDIPAMIKDVCHRYYGYDATDEKVQYMIDGLGPDGKAMS
ncbi:ABC-type Fe3+-hydroxamate transport system, periplasmic component [Thermoplasmatales archaeon BRNA1]|nr:ABC-type Fe3+-hydroxamate transport system, periplasmic component [Thermoplasmatales archaeon BRNA1]